MSVPYELKLLPNWVGFKLISRVGSLKKDKIPMNPKTGATAESNNPLSWTSYEVAKAEAVSRRWDGVGFMFEAPYLGIDLDNCVVDGKLNEFATRIVEKCNSYTEYSPSKKGIHIITKGDKPLRCKGTGIEMYQTGRFFTMTGDDISPFRSLVPLNFKPEELLPKQKNTFINSVASKNSWISDALKNLRLGRMMV